MRCSRAPVRYGALASSTSGFMGLYSELGTIAGYRLIIGMLSIARQNFDPRSLYATATGDVVTLHLASYQFVAHISDELICALGHLDIFATTTPMLRNKDTLRQVCGELEQAATLVRQFHETIVQDGPLEITSTEPVHSSSHYLKENHERSN